MEGSSGRVYTNVSTNEDSKIMKKIAIGAVAAIIAATSFASTANAGVVLKYRSGWHHRSHAAVVIRPRARVWVAPRVVIGSGCVVKKKINRWGQVVRKRWC
jgi:hypothetical protein